MILNPEQDIKNQVNQILIAARTAPKSRGQDSIVTCLLDKEDCKKIVKEMYKLYEETGKELFRRDAKNLINSEACVLIGVKSSALGLECGGCGFSCTTLKTKETTLFNGPNCIFKILDLGIALGSAVRTAAQLCIDNRLMYSIGVAAKRLNLIDADVVIAIPLSIKGKNIYFDRK